MYGAIGFFLCGMCRFASHYVIYKVNKQVCMHNGDMTIFIVLLYHALLQLVSVLFIDL